MNLKASALEVQHTVIFPSKNRVEVG